MNRDEMLARAAQRSEPWDMVIVGGGATGVGVAVDAAARGYEVLLLEQSDFGKGTSSRSTKLVHGGVRYLQQGNISLVMEALEERGILRNNAPHLVHDLPFIVPVYKWWEGPFYGVGLRVYDMLAGKYGFGRSRNLSKDETIRRLPNIETDGLRGGVIYHDGQFDDARLLVNLVQTAAAQGATLLNYTRVVSLTKDSDGIVNGVIAEDQDSQQQITAAAKVVINATGAFTDGVRRMDDPQAEAIIAASQGVHLVLDRSFLSGDTAVMIPKTSDGRVLFAIPWYGRALVGTTDTPIGEVILEPRPLEEEIDFILSTAARYLARDPSRGDVLSMFAGIRPLVKSGDGASTAALSRDHTIHISGSGLLTIAGGKWTTYRRMAEDCVDQASRLAGLETRPCPTRELPIHGHRHEAQAFGELAFYGADAPAVETLIQSDAALTEQLHPALSLRAGQVIWAVRHELARTVDDFLARRTRALLFDARAAISMAPRVAELMATELARDEAWAAQQVEEFSRVAQGYVVQ